MKIKTDAERVVISENSDITSALKKLNESATKVLLVIDNKIFKGTLTDGDIRRYILKTGKLEGVVNDVYYRNPVTLYKKDIEKIPLEEIKKLFKEKKIELIPVLNQQKEIVGYIEWSDVLEDNKNFVVEKIDESIPVVIMAGGKGSRMWPFTNVLPKPLIPIGNKTVVEYIIDEFKKIGIKDFFLTLNYKGEIMEAYFKTIEKDYNIDFIWEENFLGTAGSLKFLENKVAADNFIISNCDIIIDANLKDILDFHISHDAILTSITSIHHFKIPYGVVEISSGGGIKKVTEKPEYTFQVNTGIYIMNKKALKYIPENKYFDMPNLIEKLIKNKEKTLAYPVKESDYTDLGQWEEYKQVLEKFRGLGCV